MRKAEWQATLIDLSWRLDPKRLAAGGVRLGDLDLLEDVAKVAGIEFEACTYGRCLHEDATPGDKCRARQGDCCQPCAEFHAATTATSRFLELMILLNRRRAPCKTAR